MRVLILTSSTGGGHDMRAQALKAWAETEESKKYNFEMSVHSTLESTHPLYAFGVKLYNFIQKKSPRLHHPYFNYLEIASMHRNKRGILGKNKFRKLIDAYQPQIVLSTHAHLNHGFFALAREEIKSRLVCVTYCGELFGGYGFSKHWVNPESDLFIGAVPETCEAAARLGMAESKIWCGGFLLKPDFYNPPLNKNEKEDFIRNNLRLDSKKMILILSTGANSANNHMQFLKALIKQSTKPDVAALCGFNKEAHSNISLWAKQFADWQIIPMHYYDKMSTLLQCASAILTRPGTGTTSEAIVSACPLIFNTLGGVMPQEIITLKYCHKHSVGKVIKRADQLPGKINDWMNNPSAIENEKEKMRALQPEQHPLEILNKLHSLVT